MNKTLVTFLSILQSLLKGIVFQCLVLVSNRPGNDSKICIWLAKMSLIKKIRIETSRKIKKEEKVEQETKKLERT